MEFKQITHLITTNLPLRVISLICGFSIWMIIGQTVGTTAWLTVPVSFYNIDAQHIQAPEHVMINLAGKRIDLRSLERDQLAIHIDGSFLQKGTNHIQLSTDNLFLPDHIKLVYYSPSNIVVTRKA